MISQQEAFARIRLARSPNVGPVSFAQLLARFGTAEQALAALPDLAARGGAQYRPARADVIEAEIAATRKAGARYLFRDSADYPPLLAELDSAPPVLIVRGDAALAAQPCVAVVGARNASAAAIKFARDLAAELAGEGSLWSRASRAGSTGRRTEGL
jgi:DNA processing protein